MRDFYWPSQPVWKSSKFPTAITAAVRLPRDSIANVRALPLTLILASSLLSSFPTSLSLPFPALTFLFFSIAPWSQTYKQSAKHKQILGHRFKTQFFFSRPRTCTSPGIHTSLHSIVIICSYGYIKKYVHQGGNLGYEMFSPFIQGQEVMSRIFFFIVLSPKYGSLHRKVTLSVNSVQHSGLSFGCHVRLNSESPRPWT